MMMMKRRLACCARDRELSLDFDEQDRITTYNGLESILNNQSFENESRTSRGDGCITDSMDDDDSSCSSSKDAFGSFSSKWLTEKRDEQGSDEWELSESPQHFHVKEKPSYVKFSDVEEMKEKFSKLLLGEDVTGGRVGVTTALALSNAITNLAASVFGEFWKLEPLPEETRNRWRREMDWLLSPTNYMVQLVPAKQNCADGGTLEIMTPKARADIHMNLPALQKLDSMLIQETLGSMVDTEFWYVEVGSRAEGRNKSARESKRWWLPLPQVPPTGLTEKGRKKLLCQSKMVYQVFKAAKSINENVLLDMPVPPMIRDALPKSGKASLSEELYRFLNAESSSAEEMLGFLSLKSEHAALDVINRLETAVFVWKDRITQQVDGKSPVRTSWSFVKDPMSELDKIELLMERAEALIQQIKIKYPNLPQTFLDATRIQYGKDVGHAILEAYSRVLGNLAFSILSRIGDILKEDAVSNPNSPVAKCFSPGTKMKENFEIPWLGLRVRHSLIDKMNQVDVKCSDSDANSRSPAEANASPLSSAPSRSRVWCMSRDACMSLSPRNSP